ncbi:hypothetical protein P280DRAFT_244121 [Massarina eburnea CBS 473.64]|uniref:PH domain-containing protein n=1 Tax=Massarina eburnea CBS 473.64 TaxID=1395130 RepID=A0A6A6S8N4_9PLEO|nr:hypothetical protein P280DRAFT_244121 [Massarina eburnea CBS 473.64]
MDPPTEPQPSLRPRRTERNPGSRSDSTPPTYGYHNTFHTHATAVLSSAPSYAHATNPATLKWLNSKAAEEGATARQATEPPPYTCTVEAGCVMGMKAELSSVFLVARDRQWNDVYAVLRGTQLSIHRVKMTGIFSKNRTPQPGRLIRTFTLQHAEVGVASDFRKKELTPKSPFAHLIPVASRAKLFETDPHLFEPVREHVLRLRLETEQFLLCATTQEEMLSWSEKLCAGIDISAPLEDRSEPRYRSLPRRSRRQRVLDGARLGETLENLSSLDVGRRIIAEQEEIIRQLYPHLANGGQQPSQESEQPAQGGDPDWEEFDAEDVRFPTRSNVGSRTVSRDGEENRPLSSETRFADPKDAPVLRPSEAQVTRYRRRCAPVLLACSPRVSDVVFHANRRFRINTRECTLIDYASHPPRYDTHQFPKVKRVPNPIKVAPEAASTPVTVNVGRPASPFRGVSDDSISTFGYDLISTFSDQDTDQIRSAAPSEPPSPTALTQAKTDTARHLSAMGKRRTSEEHRDNGVTSMTVGMPFLV